MCEKALMRIASGDVDAVSDIYEVMGRQIMALTVSILRENSYAEDAMQETFLKIIENIKTYRKDGNARAWIMSIARNTAIDMQKRRCLNVELNEEGAFCDGNEGEKILRNLSVEDALGRLSTLDREIVIMKSMAGMKHREIGETVGLSEDAVQKRYKRALKLLRKLLKD